MIIVTRKLNAFDVAQQWKKQYYYDTKWSNTVSGSSEIIYNKLLALGASPNPDDIDEIIGNDGWTGINLRCNECNNLVDKTVMLGQKPGYESDTAYICKSCLLKALELMK
jgi:hypothetical protein